MAASINGFGSTYYGRRCFRRDGSYITTEWAIAATLPIFPMSSARVQDSRAGLGGRELYLIERLALDWVQVLTTYFYTYVMIPIAIYLTVIPDEAGHIPRDFGDVPWWLALLLQTAPLIIVALLPHVLRWIGAARARKRPR
ncbi:hypothetical protein C7S18_20365 [Ahniella affigens]|uniref:Uncharacterized protein n=1 Tax=Ahniella affigens TaxID=2021234 RepID=A0A2P1PX17_9GAMM|nr:hypothetical protein [Ahniella affigens]AVP99382.1 hypothetical protein C7S18_20365 [Ahniella affigens]